MVNCPGGTQGNFCRGVPSGASSRPDSSEGRNLTFFNTFFGHLRSKKDTLFNKLKSKIVHKLAHTRLGQIRECPLDLLSILKDNITADCT